MGEIKKVNRATGEVMGVIKDVSFDADKILGEPYICVYEASRPRLANAEDELIEKPVAGNMKAYIRFTLSKDAGATIAKAEGTEPSDFPFGSIVASKRILEQFKLNEDEVFSKALSNMQVWGVEITSMGEMIGRLGGPSIFPVELPVYVVRTNEKFMPSHGAGVLALNCLLEQVREEMNDDFYILPSSIHEIICISKAFSGPSVNELVEMVGCVNSTEVQPEDKLSDDVFLYDKGGLHVALE